MRKKLFLHPSTSSNTGGCAADRCAYICTHGVGFSQLGTNDNLRWGSVGESFSVFAKKNNNGILGWGTVGVARIHFIKLLKLTPPTILARKKAFNFLANRV
jgi:hypothetical protein